MTVSLKSPLMQRAKRLQSKIWCRAREDEMVKTLGTMRSGSKEFLAAKQMGRKWILSANLALDLLCLHGRQ